MVRALLLAALMPLALVPAATTQAQTARIGLLTALHPTPFQQTFVGALAEHGLIEGRNLQVERRYGEGQHDRVPALAAELVRAKVDLLFTPNAPATRAAIKATQSIPIVALDLEIDPVAAGLAASLGRPGGNLTGVFLDAAEMRGKQLEFLKNIVPGLARAAVLWDPTTSRDPLAAAERAAHTLGIRLQPFQAKHAGELVLALRAIAGGDAQALLVIASPLFYLERQRIADFARERRLPSITHFREFADAGGLLAYGPNLHDTFRRAASYVPRILTGAKPGNLPIERPQKFELVVNTGTAAAIGVVIPARLRILAEDSVR